MEKRFFRANAPLHLSRLPRKPSSSLLGLNYEVRRSHLTGMLSMLSTVKKSEKIIFVLNQLPFDTIYDVT